jgi:hypothetical protein
VLPLVFAIEIPVHAGRPTQHAQKRWSCLTASSEVLTGERAQAEALDEMRVVRASCAGNVVHLYGPLVKAAEALNDRLSSGDRSAARPKMLDDLTGPNQRGLCTEWNPDLRRGRDKTGHLSGGEKLGAETAAGCPANSRARIMGRGHWLGRRARAQVPDHDSGWDQA